MNNGNNSKNRERVGPLDTSSPLQVAFRELEFFDVGDPARIEDVFSPDLIDHNPANPEKPGIEGMRALVEDNRAEVHQFGAPNPFLP